MATLIIAYMIKRVRNLPHCINTREMYCCRYGVLRPRAAPGGWNLNTRPGQTGEGNPGVHAGGLPGRSILSILCHYPGGPGTPRRPTDGNGQGMMDE